MYRLSDLSSEQALPAWLLLALAVFDWVTRLDFIHRIVGDPGVDVTGLVALGAVLWLITVVVRARNYRAGTVTLLSDLSNYGLNSLLHLNVDKEQDFHKWLERFGVWEADTLRTMNERHCSQRQRHYFDNLHKFPVQVGLFHADPERNWWKSMMSAKIDRLDEITDQVAGTK